MSLQIRGMYLVHPFFFPKQRGTHYFPTVTSHFSILPRFTSWRALRTLFHGCIRSKFKISSTTRSCFPGRSSSSKEISCGIRDNMNQSALHLAAEEGMTDMCKYLIDRCKIDVNQQDVRGRTPLFDAVYKRQISTAVYLLKKGADPNLSCDKGFTPLYFAAERGQVELIRSLLSKGADVDALSTVGTPLHRAAHNGHPEAVKVLLDHCANPGLFLDNISSPLTAAVIAKSLRCLELLLEAGADPNVISCGVTPLHYSASDGETEMTKCLIKAGADPDITEKEGMTPLEVAAFNGNRKDAMALYPVTTPIPSYADWSVEGIMRDVRSKEANEQRKLKVPEKFEELKSKGVAAFHNKDYSGAIVWYYMASKEDPCDATVVSNRSLCWARLGQGERALSDAVECIRLKPDWPKAHYRAGAAWNILGMFDRAAEAFQAGLKLDPENKELQNALQEAVAARLKAINVNH